MLDLNSQKFLILLIITLICSITPATAVQIGNSNLTNNTAFDWNAAWSQGVTYAFISLNGEMDTELTPEQHTYLEQHEDLLENKGYGVLNNTQDILDYTIQEYNKYNKNTDNTKERSAMGDKYTDSINDIKTHLENLGYQINITSYTYQGLFDYVNCTNCSNTTNHTNVTSSIIVQIKDHNYVRYVELDNITKDDIWVHSPKEISHYSTTEFKAYV
jgi:hypothetical protein